MGRVIGLDISCDSHVTSERIGPSHLVNGPEIRREYRWITNGYH